MEELKNLSYVTDRDELSTVYIQRLTFGLSACYQADAATPIKAGLCAQPELEPIFFLSA